jgi:hypothetical protein
LNQWRTMAAPEYFRKDENKGGADGGAAVFHLS